MRWRAPVFFTLAASAAFLASCGVERPVAPSLTPDGAGIAMTSALSKKAGERIPNQYIVRLRDDAHDIVPLSIRIATAHAGTVRKIYTHAIKGFSVQISDAVAAALARHPEVVSVTQNQTVHLVAMQTDATWGLDRIDQHDRPLSTTYEYNATGDGVDVYIIDTGIRSTHTEFGGRAVGGVDEIGDGWGTDDCYGHGTHVSGTVGGTTYGVAKNVRLIAVRVLDCSGSGTYEGVIAGIDWVTADHQTGQPAVANMSLAGGYFQDLNDAVTNSINDGVVYAVAAANSYYDACAYSPASTPAALTIGATDVSDIEADFSNRGSCVDIWAPGVNVTSAWNYDDNSTLTISGTSMATPHVAGAVALYLQGHPAATASDIDDALTANATTGKITWNDPYGDKPSPPPAGQDFLLYTGFIGAAVPPAPDAPTSLTTTASSFSSIHLAWTDNSSNENAFRIERCQDAGAPCSDFVQVGLIGSNQSSYDDRGLSGSTTYRYRVRAYSSGGNSDYTNVADATTPEAPPPPNAPSGLWASSPGAYEVDLSWTDNSGDEDYFIIERCQDFDSPCTDFSLYDYQSADVSDYHDFGVYPSTTYRYRVQAHGVGGTSGYSNEASATTLRPPPPPPPPAAPSDLVASAVSPQRIDLAWTDNSGDEYYFFIERCQDAGAPCTNFSYYSDTYADQNSFQDYAVYPNSTYRYRVAAYGEGGTSAYSNEAVATTPPPPPPPKAPTGLAASAVSISQINIAWTDNSSDESGFVVERCVGAGCTTFTYLTQVGANVAGYSDVGLSSNTVYRYKVRAYNNWGTSYSNEAQATTLNQAPFAHYSWDCKNGSCTFASSSWDNDGTITSYLWNFGDNTTGSGATTSHAYKGRGGIYQVTLAVTDDRGAPASITCAVDATNGRTRSGSC